MAYELSYAAQRAGRMNQKDRCFVMGKALAALALLGFTGDLRAQTNVSVTPPPGWVRTVDWRAPTSWPKNEKYEGEGTRYLLYERQEHPRLGEEFVRIILLMENETGVQDSGNVSFYFDPSYQQLVLHRV